MVEFGREKEATMVKKGRSENACLRRKGGDSDFLMLRGEGARLVESN